SSLSVYLSFLRACVLLLLLLLRVVVISAFIELVRPFGIRELARSGSLVMVRGQMESNFNTQPQTQQQQLQQQQQQHSQHTNKAHTHMKRMANTSASVDESQLPPG